MNPILVHGGVEDEHPNAPVTPTAVQSGAPAGSAGGPQTDSVSKSSNGDLIGIAVILVVLVAAVAAGLWRSRKA